jgi:hypothetical protein
MGGGTHTAPHSEEPAMRKGKYLIRVLNGSAEVDGELIRTGEFEIIIHPMFYLPDQEVSAETRKTHKWAATERISGHAIVFTSSKKKAVAGARERMEKYRGEMFGIVQRIVSEGRAVYLAGWLELENKHKGETVA